VLSHLRHKDKDVPKVGHRFREATGCGQRKKQRRQRFRTLWRLDRDELRLLRSCIVPFSFPMLPQVSSRPASFRCTGDEASKRLESLILRPLGPSSLRRAQSVNLRVSPFLLFCDASESPSLRVSDASAVARSSHLPALPMVSSRVSPRARSLGCHWLMATRVASHGTSSGSALSASADYPAGCPAACLASCGYGWSDMTPRPITNLASPARPWMNLCFLPAPAHSLLALDAISIESQTPCRCRPGARARSDSASSCQRGTAFPIPWRSPTEEELRTVESVEASAKKELICGFHQLWCKIRRRAQCKA